LNYNDFAISRGSWLLLQSLQDREGTVKIILMSRRKNAKIKNQRTSVDGKTL
jgi:hypothetical protein